MTRNTRSITALKELKNKDTKRDILSDTNERVSKTYHLDWSWIYSIFDKDDFSKIQRDQGAYVNISKSQLHAIKAQTSFILYTDAIKWIIDHANPQGWYFNEQAQTQLAPFTLKCFLGLMHLENHNSCLVSNS